MDSPVAYGPCSACARSSPRYAGAHQPQGAGGYGFHDYSRSESA
jgi:hypothetical protein